MMLERKASSSSLARVRRGCAARAGRTVSSSGHHHHQVDNKNYTVRVLRYPDGYERVLRYPKDKKKVVANRASSTMAEEHHSSWDIAGARTAGEEAEPKPSASNFEQVQAVHRAEEEEEATLVETPSSIPNTPTELLRKQRSEEFLLSRKLEWDYVKSSYEVLDACPWPEPRPVWVLGSLDPTGEAQTFTLRTRIAKGETESELEGLLGKRISVSHLTDGVVAFGGREAADAFAEENGPDLLVFETSSGELFQMASEARAVVVLMKGLGAMPSARMLATVLRNQPELDT